MARELTTLRADRDTAQQQIAALTADKAAMREEMAQLLEALNYANQQIEALQGARSSPSGLPGKEALASATGTTPLSAPNQEP